MTQEERDMCSVNIEAWFHGYDDEDRSLISGEEYTKQSAEITSVKVKVEVATVSGLIKALQQLEQMGYGDTDVVRCDSECGPCVLDEITLYDTSQGKIQGIYLNDKTFLIG